MSKLKTVFHIDDERRWSRVLGNINNLANEVDLGDIEIEVLANGNAVNGYRKEIEDGNAVVIKSLLGKNIVFAACNNSLNSLNLSKEDLYEEVIVVKAGVLELIEKQQNEGYSYIKP